MNVRRKHRDPPPRHRRPYVLITTSDPDQELGQGVKARYATMLDASNAFAQSAAPYRTIIYDNGHEARELNEREERLLVGVCHKLGLDIEDL